MSLSAFLARHLWWAMLWWMRRPFIRRLQRWSLTLFPEGPKREKARQNYLRQERFARRIGLPVLRVAVGAFVVVVQLTLVYFLILEAFNRGWIPTTLKPN